MGDNIDDDKIINNYGNSASVLKTTSISPAAIRRIATSTPNILDILTKSDSYQTTDEKLSFLKNYIGKEIYGVGSFADFYQYDDVFRILIGVSKYRVYCQLSNYGRDTDLKETLILLQKGQEIIFSGKFTNNFLNGRYREIEDCKWLE